MPTNQSITASLVAGTVPPDRECIRNGQDVVNVVQDFMSIQTSDPDGTVSPPDDSVAQQALSTANAALAQVAALTAAQKQVRSTSPQPIPSGDSNFAFGLAPAMPDTNYDIHVTIYAGATGHPTTFYGWRILESSITTTGVTVLLDNIPNNSKASFYVVQR